MVNRRRTDNGQNNIQNTDTIQILTDEKTCKDSLPPVGTLYRMA